MASILWNNLVLKRRDTVVTKVKDSISFESFVDFRSARLSNSTKLFPSDILETMVEKSSTVLHDEAICKAVSLDKPQQKSAKSSIFRSHLGSSNSGLSIPLGHLQGSLSVQRLPLPRRPPRFLPLLPTPRS